MFAKALLTKHNQLSLTIVQVEQRGDEAARTGDRTLSLLAVPLNASIAKALADGPKPPLDLRREAGSPPQTTLRAYLRTLRETGLVDRRRRNEFPGNVEHELTEQGRDLLEVTEALEAWLAAAPDGATELGASGAKSAITALAGGWSTGIVGALAEGPLSLTELDAAIPSVSYPTLERRLAAMRLAGLLESAPASGRSKPYTISEWMRRALGPIVAAARWERRYFPTETPKIVREDAEAAFLLALPLQRMADDASGSCRLGVQIGGAGASGLAGTIAVVRAGVVEAQGTSLEGHVDGWALGSTGAWFSAIVEGDVGCLEVGGDSRLAVDLVEGLHRSLFGAVARN